MSYIDELRNSRDKAQVAYLEFALHTRKGKDGLFCFFEGKDNPYYISRIKRFTENYHPIKCHGREKVLKVYELITAHREYDKYKKAFFIDRDFNPPLEPCEPPIFETPCYSIENLYASPSVFREILINEIQLSEVKEDFVICMNFFVERQREFHEAMLLFNAWYACLIDQRNAEGLHTGVNLGDKIPKGFLIFSLEQIQQNYDLDKINATFPKANEVQETSLNQKLDVFSQGEYYKTFRGKYELQFVLQLLANLFKDANETQNYFRQKFKFKFGYHIGGSALFISHEQALNVFSAYAETPQELLDYLENAV